MQIYKLGNIVDILDSQRIPVSSDEREKRIFNKSEKSLYPYYGATQQNGFIDGFLFDEELVLLGEDGVMFYDLDKPKAYLITGKSWVNNHAHVLRGKEGIVSNSYLCYYLNTFDYHGYVNGATRLKLNQSSMCKIPVPLPPLSEQQAIAARLDEIQELIDLRRESLTKLEEYSKSLFLDMFNQEQDHSKVRIRKSFGTICRFIDYRGKTPKKTDSGIPLITAKNIKKGYINQLPEEYIAEADYESRMTRGIPPKGSIAFTTEAPLGNAGQLNFDHKFALAQRVITFIPNVGSEVLNEYLLYYLLSDKFQKSLVQNQSGSTVIGIRSSELKKVLIPLPPLSLQQDFASRIEQINALKSDYHESLDKLTELYQATMQQHFG